LSGPTLAARFAAFLAEVGLLDVLERGQARQRSLEEHDPELSREAARQRGYVKDGGGAPGDG
jgi:hypothetical protein